MSPCVTLAEVRRAKPLLGTLVEIRAESTEPVLARSVDLAFDEIATCERLLSAYRAESDVGRISSAAAGTELEIDSRTWEVLDLACRLSEASQGLFDITIAPQLSQLGYLPELPVGEYIGTWRDIELLPHHRLRLRRPLAIDLGGIGKGYAVDRAVAVLQAEGVVNGCVNAGGDLRVFGPRPEQIQLRHPTTPTHLITLGALRNGACATSAPYFASREHADGTVTPVIDPRNRLALRTFASVTVMSPACAISDALTKVVILMGDEAGKLLRDLEASAYALDTDGSLHRIGEAAQISNRT